MNRLWILAGLAAVVAGDSLAYASVPAPGWGVDSWLAGHASDSEFKGYLNLIEASGVRVARERGIGARLPDGSYATWPAFHALKEAGFSIVCFTGMPNGPRIEQAGDVLPESLLEVFQNGRTIGRDFAGRVDGWEMIGEPDVGYCRDLPDRLAAFQKALYLGIKAGAVEAARSNGGIPPPVVAMGALALPPGPWLERAVRNGLLDYTDAYNFHYYGRAADFAGVIRAHRAIAGPSLPLWVTECGAKEVSPDDFLNPERRRLQADFTADTARTARSEGLALFMPFILFDRGDPYALTLAPDLPLPAWDAYAQVTRELAWPRRPWGRDGEDPSRVVVQWMPDNRTTVPHKVSGTYRFAGKGPIRGELRVYNLGGVTVRGRLQSTGTAGITTSFPSSCDLTLAPGSVQAIPGEFNPAASGYMRSEWSAVFLGDDGKVSRVEFGVEAPPADRDFAEQPFALLPDIAQGQAVMHPMFSSYRVTSEKGPWLGLNGVRVEHVDRAAATFRATERTGDPVGDPLFPPMAVARIAGLPREGFLRLTTDPMVGNGCAVRVDLVDSDGQRYTIWENLGQSYQAPSREVWLNLGDFHPFFWGSCSEFPAFRPEMIREIQLRFFSSGAGATMRIDLALMEPR